MNPRSEKARIAILKVLQAANRPLGAARIAEGLAAMGLDLQPRTIRFHLALLDATGLTRLTSRRHGRILTDQGREELAGAVVMEKVGFVAAKVDTLGYQMTFEAERGEGSVIVNTTLIDEADLSRALVEMQSVFDAAFGMGRKLIVARVGQTIGNASVPAGSAAIGTVCSVTVNGILLHGGIPVTSRYGGLLQIKDRKPVRFVELIEYGGTTLDPLEIFIKAGMTRVRDAVRTGSGIIGASFREVPSVALEDIRAFSGRMRKHGMGGILALGRPNQPLFNIPVSEGRAAMIVVAGLNPVAAVHEAGMRVSSRSLAGLQDFRTLITIDEARRQAWRERKDAG